jgi:hypothetical protein
VNAARPTTLRRSTLLKLNPYTASPNSLCHFFASQGPVPPHLEGEEGKVLTNRSRPRPDPHRFVMDQPHHHTLTSLLIACSS